jgi:membrane protease subunit HflC
MKRNPVTLITAGVLLLIFVFMLFTFQVRQTQVAVVTTFGKYSRSITEPGWKGRWPWPIQKVYEFDNRLQSFEGKSDKLDQTITRDQVNLLISVYVGWRIADPKLFLESLNGDPARAARELEPLVRNAKSGVIGQHAFSDLISTNVTQLKFDQIEREILQGVQARAKNTYGIQIQHLGIKQLNLPESITSTVFERMRAERQRLVEFHQADGDRRAKEIRAAADVAANEILAKAKAEAIRISGQADLKAAEYYTVFGKNRELAIFLFQLKALMDSLKEKTSLILDQQTPPFNLLNGVESDGSAVTAKP